MILEVAICFFLCFPYSYCCCHQKELLLCAHFAVVLYYIHTYIIALVRSRFAYRLGWWREIYFHQQEIASVYVLPYAFCFVGCRLHQRIVCGVNCCYSCEVVFLLGAKFFLFHFFHLLLTSFFSFAQTFPAVKLKCWLLWILCDFGIHICFTFIRVYESRGWKREKGEREKKRESEEEGESVGMLYNIIGAL